MSPLDKVIYVVDYVSEDGKTLTNIRINTNITSIEGLELEKDATQFNMTFSIQGVTAGRVNETVPFNLTLYKSTNNFPPFFKIPLVQSIDLIVLEKEQEELVYDKEHKLLDLPKIVDLEGNKIYFKLFDESNYKFLDFKTVPDSNGTQFELYANPYMIDKEIASDANILKFELYDEEHKNSPSLY